MKEHYFTISGALRGDAPERLETFAPDVYDALGELYLQRVLRGANALPPITVQVDSTESDIVLGCFVRPQDTIFTHTPTRHGQEPAILEERAWCRGTLLRSPAAQPEDGAQGRKNGTDRQSIDDTDMDGHSVLILDSLDAQGKPLESGYRVGLEVEREVAMGGLFVARRESVPRYQEGAPERLFDPGFYTSH